MLESLESLRPHYVSRECIPAIYHPLTKEINSLDGTLCGVECFPELELVPSRSNIVTQLKKLVAIKLIPPIHNFKGLHYIIASPPVLQGLPVKLN